MSDFGLDDLEYQFVILEKMINQLPERVSKTFQNQLTKIRKAHAHSLSEFKSILSSNVDDISFEIKALQFDLEATRRERDSLQQKLDDLSK